MGNGRIERGRAGRGRLTALIALAVVVALLVPVAVLAGWARGQVVDEERFVATFAPVLADDAVRTLVVSAGADAAADAVPIEAAVDVVGAQLIEHLVAPANLPLLESALGRLREPLVAAVRAAIRDQAERLLASDGVDRLWERVLTASHRALTAVRTGSAGSVIVEGDTIGLDITPVVDAVLDRVAAIGLPVEPRDGAARVVVQLVRVDALPAVRSVTRAVVVAGWVVPLVAAIALVGVVLLARRRERGILVAGVALAAGGVILVVVVGVLQLAAARVAPTPASGAALRGIVATVADGPVALAIGAVAVGFAAVASGWWLTRPRPSLSSTMQD